MKRKILFCLPVLMTVWGVVGELPAQAEESEPGRNEPVLTLDAAVRLALTNNPEIQVLLADVASAQGEIVTARTWQNPAVSLEPGLKSIRDTGTTEFHGNFGLEQTLEWPGKRALRRAVAEKNVAARELALEGFRTQLTIQVRRAYFVALAAREVVDLRAQRLELAKSFAEAARKKVDGGFAPEFEATKSEIEVVAAQKSMREAQAQRDTAIVTLNTLIGRPPAERLTLTGTLESTATFPDQTALLTKALAENPAIKLQEAEAERAGLNLRSVRKSRLPDFTVGPSVEYARDEQIVGFGVSLPLPLWDRKKGEIATATAEQRKAFAELEKLRRDISSDIVAALQNVRAAKESLAFYTPAIREKLKSSLDAAAQGYSEGRTALLLYLEAQRTYFDTQTDYLETLQKFYETQAQLESAAGIPLDPIPNQTESK